MEILVKCGAAAITAAIIGLVIKKNNPEIALLLALAAAAAVMIAAFSSAGEVFEFLQDLIGITGLSEGIVAVVLKTVAVAVITGFAADVCKDAGQSALASACEMAGALTVMYTAMPLFRIVLETMGKLM